MVVDVIQIKDPIREGDFKLIQFYDPEKIELYKISEDLSETNDLAQLRPQKVKELSEKLSFWLVETQTTCPFASLTSQSHS